MGLERIVGRGGAQILRSLCDDPRAGIVLIPEVWGVDESLLGYAERLLSEQFSVAIPDPWARRPRPALATPDAVAAAVASIDDGVMLADIAAAKSLLPKQVPIFTLGFCMGGLYARMAACTIPGFAGAVEFYGRMQYAALSPEKPTQPLDLLPGLACPLQCHFGSEDPVAPPHHVEELERRLAKSSQLTQIFRYPGRGHAFLNPERPTWHADDADLAWDRAMNFLDHLCSAARG